VQFPSPGVPVFPAGEPPVLKNDTLYLPKEM